MAALDMNHYMCTRKIYPREREEDLGDSWSVSYHKFKTTAMDLGCCVPDPQMCISSVTHRACQIDHAGQEQFTLQMQ